MTTPSVIPDMFLGTDRDYLEAPASRNGAVQLVCGAVTVPSGTAATAVVGLVPFQKGASFSAPSFYCGNFGAGTTTASFGVVYDDNSTYTNDADLFASASTAPQAGGYVTLDEVEWMNYVTLANGWLAMTVNTAAADADADVTFNVGITYGSKVIA